MKRARYFRKKDIKRVYKFGEYSIAVIPSKRWLEDMGVTDSGVVEMTYDDQAKTITVRNAAH